jgi:hypothetical protein
MEILIMFFISDFGMRNEIASPFDKLRTCNGKNVKGGATPPLLRLRMLRAHNDK